MVAIGASAGGQESLTTLLMHLADNTGMTYLYVQFPDSIDENMLPATLSKATKMKVLPAKDRLPVKPNHLYITPFHKNLTVEDGVFMVPPRSPA